MKRKSTEPPSAGDGGGGGSAAGARTKQPPLLARGSVAQFYSKSKAVDDLPVAGAVGDAAVRTGGSRCGADWRRVLSNFHPCEVEVGGRCYPSVEHAFHAAKCLCSSNPAAAKAFEVG